MRCPACNAANPPEKERCGGKLPDADPASGSFPEEVRSGCVGSSRLFLLITKTAVRTMLKLPRHHSSLSLSNSAGRQEWQSVARRQRQHAQIVPL